LAQALGFEGDVRRTAVNIEASAGIGAYLADNWGLNVRPDSELLHGVHGARRNDEKRQRDEGQDHPEAHMESNCSPR